MNGAGYRGTTTATSTAVRRRIKGWLAQANDGPWYIAYLDGHITVMRVVRGRDEAIDVACTMLDQGLEVTSVGPMLGTSDQKIDRESLQEICRERRRVEMWNKTGVTALLGADWVPKPKGEY
jgi:hypothetical protein